MHGLRLRRGLRKEGFGWKRALWLHGNAGDSVSSTRNAGRKVKYTHPWNIATLAVGIGLLVVGSLFYEAPDWDIPISFIMAGFTYLTAVWSLKVILYRRWRRVPAMLAVVWWTVDGCYALYWYFVNPRALELMREANWPASLALYFACAVVWMLPELLSRRALPNGRPQS